MRLRFTIAAAGLLGIAQPFLAGTGWAAQGPGADAAPQSSGPAPSSTPGMPGKDAAPAPSAPAGASSNGVPGKDAAPESSPGGSTPAGAAGK